MGKMLTTEEFNQLTKKEKYEMYSTTYMNLKNSMNAKIKYQADARFLKQHIKDIKIRLEKLLEKKHYKGTRLTR